MGENKPAVAFAAAVGASLVLGACGGDEAAETAATPAAEGGGETPTAGVIIKGLDNPFFAAMNDGVEAAAKEHDVKVQIQAAAGLEDTAGQASKLEALMGQEMDCYVVNPITQTNPVQPLARLPKETPIVNIDSPVGDEAIEQAGLEIDTYIGTDNVAAGRLGADAMAEYVKEGAKVGVIGGVSGDATSNARIEGFREGGGDRFEALETVAGNWERSRALNAAEDLMRANPDIEGFFAANDQMALGIVQAVRNAGREDEIAVIGVDGIEDALKSIEDGGLTATVSQYPYTIGALGVEACKAAAAGEAIPKKVDAPVQVVDQENAAQALQNFPEPVEPFDSPFLKGD